MIDITQKFVSLNMFTAHSVKIADGSHSPVLGNEIVQVTSFLTLTNVLIMFSCQSLVYQSVYYTK